MWAVSTHIIHRIVLLCTHSIVFRLGLTFLRFSCPFFHFPFLFCVPYTLTLAATNQMTIPIECIRMWAFAHITDNWFDSNVCAYESQFNTYKRKHALLIHCVRPLLRFLLIQLHIMKYKREDGSDSFMYTKVKSFPLSPGTRTAMRNFYFRAFQ